MYGRTGMQFNLWKMIGCLTSHLLPTRVVLERPFHRFFAQCQKSQFHASFSLKILLAICGFYGNVVTIQRIPAGGQWRGILPSGSGSQIYLNSPEVQLGVARQIHMDSWASAPKPLG